MKDHYYHVNQPGECPVCGLSFEHMHQDKNKPKEFIRGLATKNPPERVEQKEWWMKYAEGNWVGLSSVEKIIAEAVARRDTEILEMVEWMKKHEFAEDHPFYLASKIHNDALDDIATMIKGK